MVTKWVPAIENFKICLPEIFLEIFKDFLVKEANTWELKVGLKKKLHHDYHVVFMIAYSLTILKL